MSRNIVILRINLRRLALQPHEKLGFHLDVMDANMWSALTRQYETTPTAAAPRRRAIAPTVFDVSCKANDERAMAAKSTRKR